jgi:hypothetical protein
MPRIAARRFRDAVLAQCILIPRDTLILTVIEPVGVVRRKSQFLASFGPGSALNHCIRPCYGQPFGVSP